MRTVDISVKELQPGDWIARGITSMALVLSVEKGLPVWGHGFMPTKGYGWIELRVQYETGEEHTRYIPSDVSVRLVIEDDLD